jgi:hypothetical protein
MKGIMGKKQRKKYDEMKSKKLQSQVIIFGLSVLGILTAGITMAFMNSY